MTLKELKELLTKSDELEADFSDLAITYRNKVCANSDGFQPSGIILAKVAGFYAGMDAMRERVLDLLETIGAEPRIFAFNEVENDTH